VNFEAFSGENFDRKKLGMSFKNPGNSLKPGHAKFVKKSTRMSSSQPLG
jgi:hypothetical protein